MSRPAADAQQGAAAAAAAAHAVTGGLSHAAPPGVQAEQLVVHPAAREFYEEAGAAAAALGVSVDIYAACPQWTGALLWQGFTARDSVEALQLSPKGLQRWFFITGC